MIGMIEGSFESLDPHRTGQVSAATVVVVLASPVVVASASVVIV